LKLPPSCIYNETCAPGTLNDHDSLRRPGSLRRESQMTRVLDLKSVCEIQESTMVAKWHTRYRKVHCESWEILQQYGRRTPQAKRMFFSATICCILFGYLTLIPALFSVAKAMFRNSKILEGDKFKTRYLVSTSWHPVHDLTTIVPVRAKHPPCSAQPGTPQRNPRRQSWRE
jgi:hypothetical protein